MSRIANSVVLVTGATGFLGAALTRRLLAMGAEVHACIRENSSLWRIEDVAGRLNVWRGDVQDLASVESCMRAVDPEIIFHLAGETAGRRALHDWAADDESIAVNFLGAVNAVRAANGSGTRRLRLFVRTGGLAEYGASANLLRESQRERPLTPYAASQTAATHWCQMVQGRLPFAIATLRLGLTYGPQQSSDFFIPALIDALRRDEVFEVRAGAHGRDYIFVDDVVDALVAAATLGDDRLRGAVVNVASGENVLLKDVAAMISASLGKSHLVKYATSPNRREDVEVMMADIAEANRLLDWRPSTPLREGLERTIAERNSPRGLK